MNAARLGGGIGASPPFIPFHKISLKSRSGTRSSFVRSIADDLFDHSFEAVFLSRRSTFAGKAWNAVRSGVEVKHLHIDGEEASYCVIGGIPSISSIVRNTEVVEYIV